MDETLIRISELAERTGLSQRAIHYYESLGLIHPTRRQSKGYRYFTPDALRRIEKIQLLKQLGLSLEEIATVIDAYFQEDRLIAGKQAVLEILEKHLAALDTRLAELARHRDELVANIARVRARIAQYSHPSQD